MADAVRTFTDLGARVELVDPAIADPVEAFHVLWFAGAAASIAALSAEQRARLDPALLEICEEGASRSALDYVAATAVRAELGRTMGEFHEHFDLLVTPTMPIAAFEAGVEVPPGSADGAVDELDAVHLPVQHDPAAGGERAVRLHLRRAAGRAAGGRPEARRRPGADRLPRVRESPSLAGKTPSAAVIGGTSHRLLRYPTLE